MNEQSDIRELKGIGDKKAALFHKLGIDTIGDLAGYYPRTYDIYEAPVCIGELEEGYTAAVSGAIFGRVQVTGSAGLQITVLHLKDVTGTLKVVWFRMPFLKNVLKTGQRVTLRGRVLRRKGVLTMEHPELFADSSEYEKKQSTLQPVYPLTSGLTNQAIMKAVRMSFAHLDETKEVLPSYIENRYHLEPHADAIRHIHFPENKEEFYRARKRLVFEEFLLFIVALRKAREVNERIENHFSLASKQVLEEVASFREALPYRLTEAQKRVWKDIQNDLCGCHTMSRLVQGDVGSGKTILAFLALMLVGRHGYQGALMAPTEVLARQHYASVQEMIATYRLQLQVLLLTGSMSAKEKKEAYRQIAEGSAQIIIGTHALIQEKVEYQALSLVITDEQHRFGVRQREQLAGKGEEPHVLVMSATPIPRTLAMIVYGDLDISVLDELPANRLPVKNCVVDTTYRPTAYRFIQKQVASGRQCYIICPMVEESEHLDAENVMDYTETLKKEFSADFVTAYLHGKMKQTEKDDIMRRFAENKIQVLISTTVIEVGINVPNAVVMMIENAERFGLAQLHQLRGRVGRGSHQSYCIFMSSSKNKETKERLAILNDSNDGFFIAEEDLKLRGPGDVFGIRQSGLLSFRLGDVFQDADLLKEASDAAQDILLHDPEFADSVMIEKNASL